MKGFLSSVRIVAFKELIAILISYDAFVGEQEHGTLILLLTYPLSRTALLTGKLFGQSAALGICLLLGFSVLPLLAARGLPKTRLWPRLPPQAR